MVARDAELLARLSREADDRPGPGPSPSRAPTAQTPLFPDP